MTAKDTFEFVSNVKHDLRTPLISIRGFSQLLRKKEIIDNKEIREQYIEILNRNSERLHAAVVEIEKKLNTWGELNGQKNNGRR